MSQYLNSRFIVGGFHLLQQTPAYCIHWLHIPLNAFFHYKHTAVIVLMAWRMEIVFLLYILAVLVYVLDFSSKQLGITLQRGDPVKRALSAMRSMAGWALLAGYHRHRSTSVGWGDLPWLSISHRICIWFRLCFVSLSLYIIIDC